MIVWRIATEGDGYRANELKGKGAEETGGRWNPKGLPMVYAAESRSLACLEALAGMGTGLPMNRFLVEIRITDEDWRERTVFSQPGNGGWDAVPAGKTSITWGQEWLEDRKTLVAVVPSVIVPEEWNVLLNPEHPRISAVDGVTIRRWQFDWRLRKAS